MGKKFGVNTKAEEGRARKAAVAEGKKQKDAERKESEEAQKWEQGAYKNKRKDEEEAKRLERLAKKREREEQEKRERAELDNTRPVKGPATLKTTPSLLETRSIGANVLRGASASMSSAASSASSFDGETDILDAYSASNIDDAVSLLSSLAVESTASTMDRHPERRMKAAWAAYAERELPIMKMENPTLRHTQLKERLFKQWQKSPENPFNQPHIAHTASREEERSAAREQAETQMERFRIEPLSPK